MVKDISTMAGIRSRIYKNQAMAAQRAAQASQKNIQETQDYLTKASEAPTKTIMLTLPKQLYYGSTGTQTSWAQRWSKFSPKEKQYFLKMYTKADLITVPYKQTTPSPTYSQIYEKAPTQVKPYLKKPETYYASTKNYVQNQLANELKSAKVNYENTLKERNKEIQSGIDTSKVNQRFSNALHRLKELKQLAEQQYTSFVKDPKKYLTSGKGNIYNIEKSRVSQAYRIDKAKKANNFINAAKNDLNIIKAIERIKSGEQTGNINKYLSQLSKPGKDAYSTALSQNVYKATFTNLENKKLVKDYLKDDRSNIEKQTFNRQNINALSNYVKPNMNRFERPVFGPFKEDYISSKKIVDVGTRKNLISQNPSIKIFAPSTIDKIRNPNLASSVTSYSPKDKLEVVERKLSRLDYNTKKGAFLIPYAVGYLENVGSVGRSLGKIATTRPDITVKNALTSIKYLPSVVKNVFKEGIPSIGVMFREKPAYSAGYITAELAGAELSGEFGKFATKNVLKTKIGKSVKNEFLSKYDDLKKIIKYVPEEEIITIGDFSYSRDVLGFNKKTIKPKKPDLILNDISIINKIGNKDYLKPVSILDKNKKLIKKASSNDYYRDILGFGKPINTKTSKELFNFLDKGRKTKRLSNKEIIRYGKIKARIIGSGKQITSKTTKELFNLLGEGRKTKGLTSDEIRRLTNLRKKLSTGKMTKTKLVKLKYGDSLFGKRVPSKTSKELFNLLGESRKTKRLSNKEIIRYGKIKARIIGSGKQITSKTTKELFNLLGEGRKTKGLTSDEIRRLTNLRKKLSTGKMTKTKLVKLKYGDSLFGKRVPSKTSKELFNLLGESRKTKRLSNKEIIRYGKIKARIIGSGKQITPKTTKELFNLLGEGRKTKGLTSDEIRRLTNLRKNKFKLGKAKKRQFSIYAKKEMKTISKLDKFKPLSKLKKVKSDKKKVSTPLSPNRQGTVLLTKVEPKLKKVKTVLKNEEVLKLFNLLEKSQSKIKVKKLIKKAKPIEEKIIKSKRKKPISTKQNKNNYVVSIPNYVFKGLYLGVSALDQKNPLETTTMPMTQNKLTGNVVLLSENKVNPNLIKKETIPLRKKIIETKSLELSKSVYNPLIKSRLKKTLSKQRTDKLKRYSYPLVSQLDIQEQESDLMLKYGLIQKNLLKEKVKEKYQLGYALKSRTLLNLKKVIPKVKRIEKTSKPTKKTEKKIKEKSKIRRFSKKKNKFMDLLDETNLNGKSQAYIALVKRRGRFYQVGKKTTREKALALGSSEVKSTASATFKIEKVKGFVKGKSRTKSVPSSQTFRTYKIKGGKRVQLKDTFIQKRPSRISSLGEKAEITLKGQRTRKSKTSNKKRKFGFKLGKTKKTRGFRL